MEGDYYKSVVFVTPKMVHIVEQDSQVMAEGVGERKQIKGLLSHLKRSFYFIYIILKGLPYSVIITLVSHFWLCPHPLTASTAEQWKSIV